MYRRWLYRVPFVATMNYSAAHLEYLQTHDWLSMQGNSVVAEFTESTFLPSEQRPDDVAQPCAALPAPEAAASKG